MILKTTLPFRPIFIVMTIMIFLQTNFACNKSEEKSDALHDSEVTSAAPPSAIYKVWRAQDFSDPNLDPEEGVRLIFLSNNELVFSPGKSITLQTILDKSVGMKWEYFASKKELKIYNLSFNLEEIEFVQLVLSNAKARKERPGDSHLMDYSIKEGYVSLRFTKQTRYIYVFAYLFHPLEKFGEISLVNR